MQTVLECSVPRCLRLHIYRCLCFENLFREIGFLQTKIKGKIVLRVFANRKQQGHPSCLPTGSTPALYSRAQLSCSPLGWYHVLHFSHFLREGRGLVTCLLHS